MNVSLAIFYVLVINVYLPIRDPSESPIFAVENADPDT